MSHLGAVVVKHFVCSRRYKVGYDPAGWLGVDPNTGNVTTVKSPDRESPHVVDGVYAVILLAVDNGEAPPSGLDVSRSFFKGVFVFLLEADPHVSKKNKQLTVTFAKCHFFCWLVWSTWKTGCP